MWTFQRLVTGKIPPMKSFSAWAASWSGVSLMEGLQTATWNWTLPDLSLPCVQPRWTGWSRWQLRGLWSSRPPLGLQSAVSSPGWTCEPQRFGTPSLPQLFSEKERSYCQFYSTMKELSMLGCLFLTSIGRHVQCIQGTRHVRIFWSDVSFRRKKSLTMTFSKASLEVQKTDKRTRTVFNCCSM